MAKVQTGIHNSTGTPCFAQSSASCPLDSDGGHSKTNEEFAQAVSARGLDGDRVLEIINEGNSPKDALAIVSSQLEKITTLEKSRKPKNASKALEGKLAGYFAASARTMEKARERAQLQKIGSLTSSSLQKAQNELLGEKGSKRDYSVIDSASVTGDKSARDTGAITLQKIRESSSVSTDETLTKNVKSALSEARGAGNSSKVAQEISASHSRPASTRESEAFRAALSASRANN